MSKQHSTGFAAIQMMVNCVHNAAILAYVNDPDPRALKKILHNLEELQKTLSDECPCPCGDHDCDGDVQPLVGGCETDEDCGVGFKCVPTNRGNRCRLDLSRVDKPVV